MPYSIIDFHCHHVPRQFPLTTVANAPASQKARWAETNKLISDENLLLADIEAGDIAARVVNCPTAHICDASGDVPHETIVAINDALAALQKRYPGRIFALATVDAYDGERAARELERAHGLGVRGVFVECAKGDMLVDAREARPTLEVAARLGMVVFVHPVNPQPLLGQMEPYGRLGTLLARGTINSQALIALIEGGVFKSLPELRVVVTALAFGGLALASGFSHFSKMSGGARDILRRNVFVETMDFDPIPLRAAIDMLGADSVLVGSDWPIVNDEPLRARVESIFAKAGLTAEEQVLVAGGNARRLLGFPA